MATSNVAVWPGQKHKSQVSQVTIVRNFTRGRFLLIPVNSTCQAQPLSFCSREEMSFLDVFLDLPNTKDLPWYSDMDAWFVSLALFQNIGSLVSFVYVHSFPAVFCACKSKNLHHREGWSEAALSHSVLLYRFCMSFWNGERKERGKVNIAWLTWQPWQIHQCGCRSSIEEPEAGCFGRKLSVWPRKINL